jgi:hypothetical protein
MNYRILTGTNEAEFSTAANSILPIIAFVSQDEVFIYRHPFNIAANNIRSFLSYSSRPFLVVLYPQVFFFMLEAGIHR